MRRIVGLVLAGLGTCLIVFAVLMPTYVSSRVLKFPLNEYITTTLVDSNASYFSPTKLTELTGVTMEATYTLKGNAAAGSSSTAAWNQFTYVYDQTNKLPFQTMTRTFAFDRRTAQLLNCCGANVNGDSSVAQHGHVGYVLPIGTQKKTYDVYDANVLKPVPFTFAGTDTVGGIHAYRFVENEPATMNGHQTLPGSLVGMSQSSVTLPQFYQAQVTYWIDPDTGALLKANQNEKVSLQDSSGTQVLLLFNGNLVMTQDSVNRLVAQDRTERDKMTMVTTILPLVTGIVGVILLVVGILLGRRPREDVGSPLTVPAPEPATALEGAVHSAERPSLVPGLDDEPREVTIIESPRAESPEAQADSAAAPEAAAPEAAVLEAAVLEAESPQAESPQAESPEAASPAEAPTAEIPAATESPTAVSESPAATTAEAPTVASPADMSATVPADAQTPAATAPQPAATAPQRSRRGARHRR